MRAFPGNLYRLLLYTLYLLGAVTAQAQDFEFDVLLSNGERLSRVSFTRLTPDSLIVTAPSQYTDWIAIDSVLEIRRERRSVVLPAVLVGAAAGGVVGYALKPTAVQQGEANLYSIAFGTVVGGAAGFVAGSVLQADDVIDLRAYDRREKHARLDELLRARE